VVLAPIVHNDAADDNDEYAGEDDEAGEDEKLELGDVVPTGGAEGFVKVDEDQRKNGGRQDQPDDVRFFVNIRRDFVRQNTHKVHFLFQTKIHILRRKFVPL
jgi:hypothetical protein